MPSVDFPIRCRGILFDMDGTLIDTTAIVEKCWRDWANLHGVNGDDLLAVSHGRPSFEVLKLFSPPHLQEEHQKPEYIKSLEDIVTNDIQGMFLIPGAKNVLETLPTGKWAVVTSAGRDMAKLRFKQNELPIPNVFITSTDITLGKPNPQGYLMASTQLGIRAEDCVVFEDAPAGIRAGVASGAVAVIGMNTGTVPEAHIVEAGAKPLIKDFTEIEFKVLDDGWIEIDRRQK